MGSWRKDLLQMRRTRPFSSSSLLAASCHGSRNGDGRCLHSVPESCLVSGEQSNTAQHFVPTETISSQWTKM